MTDNLPPNAALVMLVKKNGGGFDILDKDRTRFSAGTPEQLWIKAHEIVGGTALALRKPSAQQMTPATGAPIPTVKVPSAPKTEPSSDDITEAFRTVGGHLKDMASEEYGVPVVSAATTLLGVAGSRAAKLAKKASRGSKPRAKYRNRRKVK